MIFRFKAGDVAIIVQQAIEAECDVLLVKDEGLYLRTGFNNRGKFHICYAEGFDPRKNPNYFDELAEVLGGSDDISYIDPKADFFLDIVEKKLHLGIKFYEDKLELSGLRSLD